MSVSIRRRLDFAETCVFTKQSADPLYCDPDALQPQGLHTPRHPLFRSYGAKLPSSLTRVLSSALGFSPHLPVSDCGTSTRAAWPSAVSRQHRVDCFILAVAWTPHHPCFRLATDLRAWTATSNRPHSLAFCVTLGIGHTSGAGIFCPAVHHLRLSASA